MQLSGIELVRIFSLALQDIDFMHYDKNVIEKDEKILLFVVFIQT
jgi:hypothetical protein